MEHNFSKNNIYGVNPLLFSTTFIILTATLANVIRKLIKLNLKNGFDKQVLLEFIATVELCAINFEFCIIVDKYGIWMYALYLFFLTIWWTKTWENATACPYFAIEELLEDARSVRETSLTIMAQMVGGITVYRFVYILWELELIETHIGKSFGECSTDLQVPIVYGAFIEGIGTCMCRLTSRFIADTNRKNAKYGLIADSLFETMIVVVAFNYTGGYFNPVLATSLKYGCDGQTLFEFIVVYWLGACVGSIASVLIYKYIICIKQ